MDSEKSPSTLNSNKKKLIPLGLSDFKVAFENKERKKKRKKKKKKKEYLQS